MIFLAFLCITCSLAAILAGGSFLTGGSCVAQAYIKCYIVMTPNG